MKKLLCVLPVLVVMLGALTVGVGATTPKISGIYDGYFARNGYRDMQHYAEEAAGEDLLKLDLRVGNQIWIPLPAALFADSEGNPYDITTQQDFLTMQQLTAGRVKLNRSAAKGGNLDVDIALTGEEEAYIRIAMPELFVSVSDREFDYTVTLSIGGKRQPLTAFRVAGVLAVDKILLGAGDEYVDISGGLVAEAKEYIKKIDVYLGSGVSIETNMFQGKKYCGVATVTYSGEMMELNPDVEAAISLQTINLKGVRNNVSVAWQERAWVYGSNGQYLGTTDKPLPYSDMYYLSLKRLTGLITLSEGYEADEPDEPDYIMVS